MARAVELSRRLRHTGVDVPIAWFLFYRALARDDPAAAVLRERAARAHASSSLVGLSEMRALAAVRSAGFGAPVPEEIVRIAHEHANPILRNVVAHALIESGAQHRWRWRCSRPGSPRAPGTTRPCTASASSSRSWPRSRDTETAPRGPPAGRAVAARVRQLRVQRLRWVGGLLRGTGPRGPRRPHRSPGGIRRRGGRKPASRRAAVAAPGREARSRTALATVGKEVERRLGQRSHPCPMVTKDARPRTIWRQTQGLPR